jgi:hypothetical protein
MVAEFPTKFAAAYAMNKFQKASPTLPLEVSAEITFLVLRMGYQQPK